MNMKNIKNRIRIIVKKIPLIDTVAGTIYRFWAVDAFPGSKKYWEKRYATGETSGDGSYEKLAKFKAEIINSFVKTNNIYSVIEYGCGDGNQLSLFSFPSYIGLDVSETAIRLCIKRFKNDKTKSFFLYCPTCLEDNHSIFKAELTLSLDVIYHLIEENTYELYMKHLFSSADKFVIIYSSDTDKNPVNIAPHCKNRKFSKWIEINLPEWKLIKKIKNKYPNESGADFFFYKKVK